MTILLVSTNFMLFEKPPCGDFTLKKEYGIQFILSRTKRGLLAFNPHRALRSTR